MSVLDLYRTAAHEHVWLPRPEHGQGPLPKKYLPLVDAPFRISDQCCDMMKKKPLGQFARQSSRCPITGEMASDSAQRELTYLRYGSCNVFNGKNAKSTPMAIWTDQDVLRYLLQTGIPYASVYGEIVVGPDGVLKTTGEVRTGCIFCMFGLDQELKYTGTHRFNRLRVTHPQLYAYCMEKIGLRKIIRYLGIALDDEAQAESKDS